MAIIIIGLIFYWQIRYNVIYADFPSGSGSLPKVEIIVHIDNIPTIIRGAFVDKLYTEWAPNIAYAASARIAAGIVYNLPTKNGWSSGSVKLKNTPFEVDFILKRLKLKDTSIEKFNVFVDTAREINLNLSGSGKSDLLKLDWASFNGLTSQLLCIYDTISKTQDIVKIEGQSGADPRYLSSSKLSFFWPFETPAGSNRFTLSTNTSHGDLWMRMPAGPDVIDSLPYKAQIKFSHAKSLSTEASKAAYNARVANNEEKRAQNALKLAYEALDTYYITGERLDHPAESDFLKDQYFKAKDAFKKINIKAACFRGAEHTATIRAKNATNDSINTSIEAILAARTDKDFQNSSPQNSSPQKSSVIGLDIFCGITGYSEEDVDKFIESFIKRTFHYLKAYWPYIIIFLFFVLILIIICQILVNLKKKNLDFIKKIEDKLQTLPYGRYLSKFIIRLIYFLGYLSPVDLIWAVSWFFLYIGYFKDMD